MNSAASAKDRTPFFLARNQGFVEAKPEDDYLHPHVEVTGDSATETQYFGFNIPEAQIHGYMYFWHHTNLGVISGGPWAWQGIKRDTLACDLADQLVFTSDKILTNDLRSYTLPNSYSVTVVEPLKKHHVTYSDPVRGNHIDLHYEALMPPAMFGDGKHFEQGTRVRGEVMLRGKRHRVDGYNIRDRSWGKQRPEDIMPNPPIGWHTGAFNDGFFFNCTAFDHPDLDPDWKRDFPDFPAERTFVAGWIYLDGELTPIVECKKKTVRNRWSLFPDTIQLAVVDAKGRAFTFNGKVIAASHYGTWYNIRGVVGLTRWECNGRVGYGDTQEPQWNDYVHAAMARSGDESH